MNLKKNHYSRRALALLLTLVMCVGMIPTAFAAQQNSYHDPAEHWMQASGRTNELDANSVVTRETFKCGECGKATSFEVFRVPEYTRNGQPALSRNVKYSDGTMVDGVGKGDTMDGIPGKDATYTGYHYICAPLRGDVTNNVEFARQKAQEVFAEGNIPICPHLLFPPVADPDDPAQDEKARAMGLRLLESCQQMNVYGPVWTDGMWQEIYKAGELGIPVLTDQKTIGRTPPARHPKRKER